MSSPRRAGLTLIELLISISMMAVMAAALGVVARAVRMASDYTDGYSTVTQHARVTLDRISKMVGEATANETFPGAVLFADSVSGYRYPDTLVIWHPTGAAASPTGLPLFREIVVYAPNPSAPNQLLEITNTNDSRSVPALANTSAWTTELNSLKTGNASTKTVLTDLMRTAKTGSSASSLRGAVRFEVELRPSATEWANYRAGSVPWANVAFAQSIYGSQTGLRQVWVRSELQLLPAVGTQASSATQSAPFFGSGALYYQLSK